MCSMLRLFNRKPHRASAAEKRLRSEVESLNWQLKESQRESEKTIALLNSEMETLKRQLEEEAESRGIENRLSKLQVDNLTSINARLMEIIGKGNYLLTDER